MTGKVSVKTLEQIGRKLREIRERKGFSQEEVAKSAGYSTNYYAGIERGEENPTVSVIENICRALKIKLSSIIPS